MADDHSNRSDEPSAGEPASMFSLGAIRSLFHFVRGNPFKFFTAAAGVVAFLGAVALLVVALSDDEPAAPDPNPSSALAMLDVGDFTGAKQLAVELHHRGKLSYEDFGIAAYVLGAANAENTKTQTDERKIKQMYLLASRYLDESRQHGFPSGRKADGLFLLGQCLYHSGQHEKSIVVLQDAIKANAKQKKEIHRLLADAHFYGSDRNIEQALTHVDAYLAQQSLTAVERDLARIQRCRILLAAGYEVRCEHALNEIADDSPVRPMALVVGARLQMFLGDKLAIQSNSDTADKASTPAGAKYKTAIELLTQAASIDNAISHVAPESSYLIGVCHAKLGQFKPALERLQQTRRRNLRTSIALAAGLAEANTLRALGSHDKAVEVYERILHDAGTAETFTNRWLSLRRFRSEIHEAYAFYSDSGMFEKAMELAESVGDTFPASESLRWQAAAIQSWAREIGQQAKNMKVTEADDTQQKAREKFRQAGRLFKRLADLRIATREYSEDLWQSAASFLEGRDFRNASAMLKKYMQHAPSGRLARAQVALGKSQLALDNFEAALEPLLSCIQLSPNDPITYQARLLASQVYLELNQPEQSKTLLIENLENEALTPESIEWRDSSFALGKLMHQQASVLNSQSRVTEIVDSKKGLAELEKAYDEFQDAILRLEDFVERNELHSRDWADPRQFVEARYLLADAHRLAAHLPRKKLASSSDGRTRAKQTGEMQIELNQANEIFESVEADLRRKEDESELTEFEHAVLRNCYFSRGDVLFDLERYDEAIKAYSSARNRYHDRPESLEAFVQIANCYRRLDRQAEARRTLQQARVALDRMIDPKAEFNQTTRYGREEWGQLLDWLSKL